MTTPRPAGGATTEDGASVHRRSVELRTTSPFRLDLTSWALRRRPLNEMDVWGDGHRRGVLIDGAPATLDVVQTRGPEGPRLRMTLSMATPITDARLTEAIRDVEALVGLGTDLDEFYDVADRDPRLAQVRDRFLGVRPPRFPTLFEALANAIANQQLSLEVGLGLLNRLSNSFGAAAPGVEGLTAFPSADAIAAATVAPLREMGFSVRKAEYLIGAAQAIVTGDIDTEELGRMDRAEATCELTRLRGIGRWSAEYVLLRGLGRLDVFPGDDVGAGNNLQRFFDLRARPTYEEITELLLPWRPYAGMVYFHLLLDGLARRGALDDG